MRGIAHRRNAGWLWLLIAAALFIRAVVPQGFMPETERGTLTIRVCHSDAVIEIPAGPSEQRDDGAHKDQPCAFAGLFAAADTPAELAVGVPPAARELRFAAPERVQRAAALYPRPPSRAPPARA